MTAGLDAAAPGAFDVTSAATTDEADALIREGYATPLHAAAPVPAQAPKKGQKKENHMADGSRAACGASSEESAQAERDSACMGTPQGDEQ